MKRSLTMAALFVILFVMVLGVTSCTVATNNNAAVTNGNTNAPSAATNGNANMSAATGGGAAMTAEVTAKEKQLWDALKNKDHEAFGNMLSSDSVYVSSDVVSFDKAATVNGVKNFAPSEVNLSDWKTVVLDRDAAVVTYTLNVKGTAGGQPIPAGAMRASTAWVKRGAEWVAVFHQDSLVEEHPPATPAAETAKPAASAPPANANTPASATKHAEMVASDDPVAIEKHLWEVLKQKDWDAFASHLADDQLEVGPSGVYDKAATLATIKQWDFTKATPSNFKGTKLDDDATLVTYTIKGTGMDGKPFEEHASSIWVKRGGKWLAAFHQGTPVVKTPAK